MSQNTDRRTFLKTSAAAGLGLALGARATAEENPPPGARVGSVPAPYQVPRGFSVPPIETVRMAFVGVGLQGGSHVQNFLRVPGVEIVALCDIDAPRAEEVAGWVEEAGRRRPVLYTRGETDYLRLCERDDLDLVFNATPWRWHVPVCLAAMESGKHTAVEVPAAYTLEGCWQLVETAERTLRHCVMMENVCYGRSELMVLNMVRQGIFGEILHGEAAYLHDLRTIKFSDKNEGLWRLAHSVTRNGNLYPTHGLGPVAQYMNINRGDAFDYLVSMSSPARGLALYAEEHLPPEDPRRHQTYRLGDMNSSLIRTKLGRTILLQHDTTSPRPYSRLNFIQGTRGAFGGFPDRIFLESPACLPGGAHAGGAHGWEDVEPCRALYEHPLWKKLAEDSEGAGHGGMDFVEDWRLIDCLHRGEPLDMDVYDAAAWSAPTELSELSVARRSQAVDFPDFTRGRWPLRTPLPIVG